MTQAADISVEIVFKVLMKSQDCRRENNGMRLGREGLGSQHSCANYVVAFVNKSLSVPSMEGSRAAMDSLFKYLSKIAGTGAM